MRCCLRVRDGLLRSGSNDSPPVLYHCLTIAVSRLHAEHLHPRVRYGRLEPIDSHTSRSLHLACDEESPRCRLAGLIVDLFVTGGRLS